jgi:serine/threonine protein kinase
MPMRLKHSLISAFFVAQHGPLPPATALRVVLQVAQALEAAQAHRLIHRDIKPGNVIAVTNRAGSLDVKLIDFGLAKGAGTEALDAARITRTQDFIGSPAFASPEQCEMEALDTRSDIYSLGVTLWYLLSGKRPFLTRAVRSRDSNPRRSAQRPLKKEVSSNTRAGEWHPKAGATMDRLDGLYEKGLGVAQDYGKAPRVVPEGPPPLSGQIFAVKS